MELAVHTQCAYYPAGKRNGQGRWDSSKYCLAVKSREIQRSATIPGLGVLTSYNIQAARPFFGGFIRRTIKQLGLADYVIVPAPSKDSFDTENFRTYRMLREAVPGPERIDKALLFAQQAEHAALGGPRGYEATLPLLRKGADLQSKNVILVDDIVTTGGTMLACKTMIERSGGVVVAAIACGRTDEFEPNPFATKVVTVHHHQGIFDF